VPAQTGRAQVCARVLDDARSVTTISGSSPALNSDQIDEFVSGRDMIRLVKLQFLLFLRSS
jgi:hypothetical protein